MKKLLIVAVLFVATVASVFGQIDGVGLDLRYSLTSNMVTNTDNPTRTGDLYFEVPVMTRLIPEFMFEPFVGLALSQVRDKDLPEPLANSQFGFSLGAGLYKPFIDGGIIDVSLGPQLRFVNYFMDKADNFATFADMALELNLMMNLDLALSEQWMLRFGVDVLNFAWTYQNIDGTKDWDLLIDSQLLKGSALVSIRYLL
jgi:hypothetical protein